MRVVRLHGKRDLRLAYEDRPNGSDAGTLVQVTAVGICGSDLHWYEDAAIGATALRRPLVLGHEFAGEVETGGRRRVVAVDPAVACGRCEWCMEGEVNLCGATRFAGHDTDDGAMREYLTWPDASIVDLPPEFDAVDGAMLEPLGVAIHAVDLGRVYPGATVGVFGSGPIGLLTIQVARAAGASTIVATDVLSHRLDAALAHGATYVFEAEEGRESEDVLKATGGRGLDVAFEAAGVNRAVTAAVASVRPGARVVLIGIPDQDDVTISASVARRKGLTIKWVHRMKHTYPRAIALVRSGLVDVRGMVSHRFPLDDFERAFQVASRREGLKVVIEPAA